MIPMKHILQPRLAATFTLLLAFLFAAAQISDSIDTSIRHHSLTFGVGTANVLDTYLSPYAYKGNALQLQRETSRATHLLQQSSADQPRVALQTLCNIDFASVENPAGNVTEYVGGMRYSLGWLYRYYQTDYKRFHFSFTAGPMLSTYLGAIYHERNGNNPFQAKFDMTVDLTAQANCQFYIKHRRAHLRYQLFTPLFGFAFSPNYGQSYYEAFELGNSDHNIVFAHVGNMPSMRHLLTFDIQLRRHSATTLRIGYSGNFMQSKFNNLRYHSYTHTFLFGVTKTFKRL